jgi:hypothetical protein
VNSADRNHLTQVATEVQKSIVATPAVYELPEVGSHTSIITKVEDRGDVPNDKYGPQHMVRVHILLDDEKSSKGESLYVFVNASLKLGEKARLGKFLRGLGVATDSPVDLANLVGRRILTNVVHNKVGDKTYANVESVSSIRAAKTTTKTAAQAPVETAEVEEF